MEQSKIIDTLERYQGSGKTPAVYAGVASAVAFMGPKRRRPPMFYFSSMMAVDAEVLMRAFHQ